MKRKLLELFGGEDVKKLLSVLDGHKTELGLVIAALPDIANALTAFLQSLLPIFAAFHMDGAAAATIHASGLILAGVGGIHRVWKILSELLKDPKAPPKAAAGLVLVLTLTLPGAAGAQTHAPSPAPEGVKVELYGGAMQFAERGQPDRRDFVYRLTLAVPAPYGLTLSARADYTRTQDGGDLLDPHTFRSVEAFAGVRKKIAENLEAVTLAGVSWNRDAVFEPVDPRLWTAAAGAKLTVPGRGYVLLAAGHHGPVGGAAGLLSIVYDLEKTGAAAWFCDVAVPFSASGARPYTVKAGISARLKGWTSAR